MKTAGTIILKKYSSKIFFCTVVLIFILLYNHILTLDPCEYIEDDDIEKNLMPIPDSDNGKFSCPVWPTLNDEAPVRPQYIHQYNETEYAFNISVKPGGYWKPVNCAPRHHVALVIPYRGREKQLRTFLYYIHPFLQKQLISYRIFIVEQSYSNKFNRGKLMNIGYAEAMKLNAFPCFIFHDVDLLPEVLKNIYACTKKPRHMSSSINTWQYKLLYNGAFGGVIAVQQKHFQLVNGYSNLYFGWGGEDDDLLSRMTASRLYICRFSQNVARYYMLYHELEDKNPERFDLLKVAPRRFGIDGLNSLQYIIISYKNESLFTRITVDI